MKDRRQSDGDIPQNGGWRKYRGKYLVWQGFPVDKSVEKFSRAVADGGASDAAAGGGMGKMAGGGLQGGYDAGGS